MAERQRIAFARAELETLDKVDAVVTLNNTRLGEHLADALDAQAALSAALALRDTRVLFGHQRIAIETTVSAADGVRLVAHGEIELDYSGDALEWFPVFRRVSLADGLSLPWSPVEEPSADTVEAVLETLNQEVARALVDRDANTIPVDIVPAVDIRVGATLPGRDRRAEGSARLADGVFVVRGAVTVVAPEQTRLALDLEFQPSLAECPEGITVSRALFASDVVNREPVAGANLPRTGRDARLFYTEIAGADEPLTVVHYWFADGRATAVTELTVEPSARWRTWSSRGEAGEEARRYQVLVVHRSSGCILHSQSVRVPEDIIDIPGPADTADGLRVAFDERAPGFGGSVPGVASVEVSRAFLADVLQAGAGDITVEARFDDAPYPGERLGAQWLNPGRDALACAPDDCRAVAPAACTLSLDGCERLRDTRECTSCLFRNPLNNRCVRQATDPICEAARTRQNARYDLEWQACVDRAERSLAACEERRVGAGEVCASGDAEMAARCDRLGNVLDALARDRAVADATLEIAERGPLAAVFSGFEIEGDFERLRVDLGLRSRMTVSGTLDFSAREAAAGLRDCLASWEGSFAGRLDSPGTATRLLATLDDAPAGFVASWSGWAIPFRIDPAPLDVRATSAARPVAACGGIDAEELARSMVGEGAPILGGDRRIELVPTPSRLVLGEAELRFGERAYRAPPAVMPETVLWTIGG